MKIEKASLDYVGSLGKGEILFNGNEAININVGAQDLYYDCKDGRLKFSLAGLSWTATDNWHIYKIEEKEDEKG